MSSETESALYVAFETTELREKDEIDKTAFTMYQLQVTRGVPTSSNEDTWTLFRRYSQFHQLMTILLASHPETKTLSETFPPKKTLGNLLPSFVDGRKTALQAWVNSLLAMPGVCGLSEVQAFFEARQGLSQEGSAAPSLELKDISNRTFDSKQFDTADDFGHIIIYSAASRYNFSKLQQAMGPAFNSMIEKYPTLKFVNVNVADLREVPENYFSYVNPILASVDGKNRTQAQIAYSVCDSATKKKALRRSRMFFIGDNSGDGLQRLGFEDSNWTFRVSVVMGGQVQCSLQSSSKQFSHRFHSCIDRLVSERPSLISDDLETEAQDRKEKKVSVSAGRIHSQRLIVSDSAWLCWDFKLIGSEHVEFALLRGDDEKSAEVLLPMSLVKAQESHPCRGAWKVVDQPGTYIIQWSNKMSSWSSKTVVYKAFLM